LNALIYQNDRISVFVTRITLLMESCPLYYISEFLLIIMLVSV